LQIISATRSIFAAVQTVLGLLVPCLHSVSLMSIFFTSFVETPATVSYLKKLSICQIFSSDSIFFLLTPIHNGQAFLYFAQIYKEYLITA